MTPFARFVARKDGGLILGKNFHGLLKPDTVYQIEEILGELVIREVGQSAIADGIVGLCWGRDANSLIEDGSYLYTSQEYAAKCALGARS